MQQRTLVLLVLLLLCAPATYAAKRKSNKEQQQTVVIPVYDTIRVVVTDTIKVEPKPAPRIDTLRLAHTPAEIDSLVKYYKIYHR